MTFDPGSTQNVSSTPEPIAQDTGSYNLPDSPWKGELEGLGLAPEHLQKVDSWYRGKQGHVTQLEQQNRQYLGMFGNNPDALAAMSQIYSGFANEETRQETYEQLGEMLGLTASEVAEAVGDDDYEDYEGDSQESTPYQEWIEAKMAEEQAAAEDADFQTIMDGLAQEVPGFDEELFIRLVMASGGDLQAAWDDYAVMSARYAVQSPPPPPPTIGESVPGPREETKPSSMEDIWASYWSSQNTKKGY